MEDLNFIEDKEIKKIKKKLKRLGIKKSDQLIKHDLNFWYLKTLKKNYKKFSKINLAKEELEKFTNQELINILNYKFSKPFYLIYRGIKYGAIRRT